MLVWGWVVKSLIKQDSVHSLEAAVGFRLESEWPGLSVRQVSGVDRGAWPGGWGGCGHPGMKVMVVSVGPGVGRMERQASQRQGGQERGAGVAPGSPLCGPASPEENL